MYEDALSFQFLGMQLYAYGLMLMLGCWLGLSLFVGLSGKDPQTRHTASLAGLLSLPLGLVLARLFYIFLNPGFGPLLTFKNSLALAAGGYAMFGALLGAVLALLLVSRWKQADLPYLLDRASIGLMAFLVPARLGEGFTSLGISRPLTSDVLKASFLARMDEYDAYLRTYLLEAAMALLILLVLLWVLKKNHRPGQVFLLACLLFGISQTLMESLRFDFHLRHSFVGVQQVLSVVLFSLTLIYLAIQRLKTPGAGRLLPILSLALLPPILGGILGVEFMVDRSQSGKLVSYGLYILVLMIPLFLGILLLSRRKEAC